MIAGPEPWLTAAAGMLTGLLGAILGLGGGLFLVPILILFFGVEMSQAAGAGLVAAIATSTVATSYFVSAGTTNLRLGVILETAAVLGALTGGVSAAFVPVRALIGLFAVLLAGITVVLWRKRRADGARAAEDGGLLSAGYYDPAENRTVRYTVRRLPAGLAAGFAAGNLAGLLGIGGGVLVVPVMHLYCGLPIKAAAATSAFMISITASSGALVYVLRGALDPVLSGSVALGALLGSWAGARLGVRLPGTMVRRIFGVVTALLAVGMLRRAIYGG